MKKQLPLILILIAAIGIGYTFINKPADSPTTASAPLVMNTAQPDNGGALNPAMPGAPSVGTGGNNGSATTTDAQDGEDTADVEDVKPAAVAFKSAQEALDAIKKGSIDYDDSLLEQFTQPGEDCSWCPELYRSVKDLLKSPEYKNEQKSFFAEILAISGRVDNVQSLIEGYKSAQSSDEKQIYTSALELVSGKEDVVEYLGSQLKTDNAELKESVVAAITNQGTPLALETLYKHTVENGDPDGYYSQGVGLGEMILDDAALPRAQQLVEKRDAYSPLLVKALLNSGINGLRIVMDILANSKDPEGDKRLIKGAVEHVSYDEQVEEYLKQFENHKSQIARDFANAVRQDFNSQEDTTDNAIGDEDEQLQSPVDGQKSQ